MHWMYLSVWAICNVTVFHVGYDYKQFWTCKATYAPFGLTHNQGAKSRVQLCSLKAMNPQTLECKICARPMGYPSTIDHYIWPMGPQMGMAPQHVGMSNIAAECTSSAKLKDLMLTFQENGRHAVFRHCLIKYLTITFISRHFTNRALMSDGKITACKWTYYPPLPVCMIVLTEWMSQVSGRSCAIICHDHPTINTNWGLGILGSGVVVSHMPISAVATLLISLFLFCSA